MCDGAAMPLATIPPGAMRHCACSFPGRRDQIGRARALIARFLEGSPAADDAVLLTSELSANACAHSASGRPGGRFVVRAQVSVRGPVYVEVEDQGSAWDGTFGAAESPHGLYLLCALSAECGTRRGNHGWATWFLLTP